MTKKDPNAMAEAFRALEPILKAPEKYPDHLVVLPAGSPILAKIFSKEPTRIIEYLRKHGPISSIQQLAEVLGRDPAAVSRDVHILEQYGLLSTDPHGREKRLSATNRSVLVA